MMYALFAIQAKSHFAVLRRKRGLCSYQASNVPGKARSEPAGRS